jgi:hypothetical protein
VARPSFDLCRQESKVRGSHRMKPAASRELGQAATLRSGCRRAGQLADRVPGHGHWLLSAGSQARHPMVAADAPTDLRRQRGSGSPRNLAALAGLRRKPTTFSAVRRRPEAGLVPHAYVTRCPQPTPDRANHSGSLQPRWLFNRRRNRLVGRCHRARLTRATVLRFGRWRQAGALCRFTSVQIYDGSGAPHPFAEILRRIRGRSSHDRVALDTGIGKGNVCPESAD